jgi:hypothetical protein
MRKSEDRSQKTPKTVKPDKETMKRSKRLMEIKNMKETIDDEEKENRRQKTLRSISSTQNDSLSSQKENHTQTNIVYNDNAVLPVKRHVLLKSPSLQESHLGKREERSEQNREYKEK